MKADALASEVASLQSAWNLALLIIAGKPEGWDREGAETQAKGLSKSESELNISGMTRKRLRVAQ